MEAKHRHNLLAHGNVGWLSEPDGSQNKLVVVRFYDDVPFVIMRESNE